VAEDRTDRVPVQRPTVEQLSTAQVSTPQELEQRRRRLGVAARRAHLARRREVLLHLTRS